MLVALLPVWMPAVKAVTTTYTPSAAYAASEFYDALLEVELTGDQREDIINVALSQVGYREGSSSGDTGGTNSSNYNNYTETNYWYHNYINSGMPLGGSYAPWCATFVSWCAEQARVPTSILKRSTAAGQSSYYFNVYFYAGGSTLASSGDNNAHFLGYNYTPKKGDLFFTRSWSHVGLVVSSDGTYVTTVEGNTNSGGSAEGEGVFVRTRYVDDLYFGVPKYEDNSVKDYVTTSCTYYPAHCQVSVTDDTPINSQPCAVSSEHDSSTLVNATAGQSYTATALYRNSYGNYWYRVNVDDSVGYLYAGDCAYVEQITSDITITDYDVPNGHPYGEGFDVTGTIASKYNRLDTAACYIYEGFQPGSTAVTGYSDTVSNNKYVVKASDIDYGTKFGILETGNHTYEFSATYTNYYATSATTIASNTGTVKLLSEYFVVIPSYVDQSACNHTYTTTVIQAASCQQGGTSVMACSTCGVINKTETATTTHAYGDWVNVNATCTTDGSQTRSCTTCGNTETRTIPATGHDYHTVTHAATCKEYARYEYTCNICGDYFMLNAGELASGWIDYLPEGMDSSLFTTKTQYRYSDYETKTSYETVLPGYTVKSSEWVEAGTTTVEYVNSWPSGFSTASPLYTKYNAKSNKVSASETATTKTTVESDEVVGYLYYHWCYEDSYYSQPNSTGSYTTFHAYYSDIGPNNYTCDPSDMSYKTSHSCCSNSEWFFVAEVYGQKSVSFNKLFTYERWSAYSDWSDTVVTAGEARRVEKRNVYQLKSASLGSHVWQDGVCTACGAVCDHNYANDVCTVCGMGKAQSDYYLFGFINGADYACEGDYENMGIYKFVDGSLTVTFDSDSYVGVKSDDNTKWYMTNGWQGYETTTVTLQNTNILGSSADKLYVPGGVEVTFTLVVNEDDTLTLSYVAEEKEYVKPTITPKYPSLSFEGEIFYNITFVASDVENAVEWGLITFESNVTDGTVDNADYVIPGHTYDAASGYYKVRSNGIAAKKLGDTLYFRVYAKLTDGTYAYSGTYNYSAAAYAKDRLANSTNAELKSLCVAMLNYGAAAQNHFAHNTGNLANSFLTTAQAALVQSYSSDLLAAVGSVDTTKNGTLSAFSGYSSRYPSVSFEGAFGISYYFTPSNAMDNGLSLYYWTAADYAAASTLSPNNASGKLTMEATGVGSYKTTVSGIAAKDIDSTIYVVGIYFSGGTMHCTGVLPYSLGAYCVDRAANSTGTMQALAKATAVYGYYARQYFTE